MQTEKSWERLSAKTRVRISREHRFNTDTLLLAWFSMPKKGERCADLGTGCGTIPLFWCDRGEPGHVWGVEIQPQGAELLGESIEANGLEEKIGVLNGDLRDTALLRERIEPGSLDRMACNPPYTPEGRGDPASAESRKTARYQGMCTFEDVARAARLFLRWGGRFCCCQRPEYLAECMAILGKHGLEPKRLRLVQQREGKAPFLFLLESRRGGKPGMEVQPVLLVEKEGSFSPEMLEIYGAYREGRENGL